MEQPAQTYRHTTQFGSLLRFFLRHDYYTDGVCRDIRFIPTPETVRNLQNYRIRYRIHPDGFELASDLQHDYSHPVFTSEQLFQFDFINQNPHFQRFTDMPMTTAATLQFDTAESTDERLHTEAFATHANFIPSTEDGIRGSVIIRHQPEKPLWGPDAKYYRYYARFAPRIVKFRYIFYGNPVFLENYSTFFMDCYDDLENPIKFTEPRPLVLRSGEESFSCTTEEMFPMKDRWKLRMALKRIRGNRVPFDYMKTLPTPQPEGILYDENEKAFVAQQFVKL